MWEFLKARNINKQIFKNFSISPGLNTEFSERLENCLEGVEYTNQDIKICVIIHVYLYKLKRNFGRVKTWSHFLILNGYRSNVMDIYKIHFYLALCFNDIGSAIFLLSEFNLKMRSCKKWIRIIRLKQEANWPHRSPEQHWL